MQPRVLTSQWLELDLRVHSDSTGVTDLDVRRARPEPHQSVQARPSHHSPPPELQHAAAAKIIYTVQQQLCLCSKSSAAVARRSRLALIVADFFVSSWNQLPERSQLDIWQSKLQLVCVLLSLVRWSLYSSASEAHSCFPIVIAPIFRCTENHKPNQLK